MRPLFMLTTELISIPTGFIFPGRPGDAVEGKDPFRSRQCCSSLGDVTSTS